jgi:TonB family protein
LNAGRSDTDYAESLLGVASHCIHARRTKRIGHPLMQTMLDQNTLIRRISRVLEENKMQASDMQTQIKKTIACLLVLSAGLLSVLGATQVLSAQEQRDPPATRAAGDEEMLPLHNEQPLYPRTAAEAGIEGWVHVKFTVNAAGTIDENSLAVVDAEPADTFNNSALAAASKFRFSPRIRGGEAVAVPNVQYVFRYKLNWDPADTLDPVDTRAPLALTKPATATD